MQQPLAYLNGELVPADQAVLPVFDAGIVQAATVSETLRTFDHQLFRLEEHLDRFTNSLATVGFNIGMETDEVAGICRDLVAHNTVSLDSTNDLGLVVFATAGPYATYSGQPAGRFDTGPTLCVHSFPLPFHLWRTMQAEGLHLVTPSVQQLPDACIDPSIKHRSRLHYYLADREAAQIAAGARAVLLDQQGRLQKPPPPDSCWSTANKSSPRQSTACCRASAWVWSKNCAGHATCHWSGETCGPTMCRTPTRPWWPALPTAWPRSHNSTPRPLGMAHPAPSMIN